ncbi:hypothetical protein [Deinococcus actinosclerus]|uniref:Phage tail protein n=1 Tax=Deinococcus actinosclerus TaxID=1768108 RepID=A0ABM5X6X0_9DEIO|nr:hypothetical protein [Deinococcus actinosclerus]ALW89620.1 hypothetical protein AUC44_12525 [Deinococcus actinosclerus]
MAVKKGKGTKIRWAVLAAGATARPSSGLTVISGLQSSEIKGGQDLDNAPNGDYDSTDGGWRDGDTIRQKNWTFTLGGHVVDGGTQAEQISDLWDAWSTGLPIWIERLRPGDTKWKGGRVILQDPTEPAPYDGELTFAFNGLGQGAIVETPDSP